MSDVREMRILPIATAKSAGAPRALDPRRGNCHSRDKSRWLAKSKRMIRKRMKSKIKIKIGRAEPDHSLSLHPPLTPLHIRNLHLTLALIGQTAESHVFGFRRSLTLPARLRAKEGPCYKSPWRPVSPPLAPRNAGEKPMRKKWLALSTMLMMSAVLLAQQ